MRTLEAFQLTEERLLQTTNLSQVNQDKESILSQLDQAQEKKLNHSLKYKVTARVRQKLLQLLQVLVHVVIVIIWIVLVFIFILRSIITVWSTFASWNVIQVKVLIIYDLL